jgi:hypothetical protein
MNNDSGTHARRKEPKKSAFPVHNSIDKRPKNWAEIGDYYYKKLPKERAAKQPHLEFPTLTELKQAALWLNAHRETKELQELVDAWVRFREQFIEPQKELDRALAVVCDDPYPRSCLMEGRDKPSPCDTTLRTLMYASRYQFDHLIEFHTCPACGKDFASAPQKGQRPKHCDDRCRDRFRRGWRNGKPDERAAKAFRRRLNGNLRQKGDKSK